MPTVRQNHRYAEMAVVRLAGWLSLHMKQLCYAADWTLKKSRPLGRRKCGWKDALRYIKTNLGCFLLVMIALG
jgi:hypothetical protein